MMRTLRTTRHAATILVATAFAQPAFAGHSHCGGGGGSSGGGGSTGGGGSSGGYSGGYSGGSSSGSYSSYYGSETATIAAREASRAPVCDNSDVVGYRTCTRYGAWSKTMDLPRVFIEMGTNFRQFGSQLGSMTDSVTHGGETFNYKLVMPGSAGPDTAMTSAFRFGVGIHRGLYVAAEAELGGLVAPARASTEMMSGAGTFGMPTIGQGRGFVTSAAGVVGVRNATKHATIALEAAGGLRAVRYKFSSTYHECFMDWNYDTNRSIVEARARGELWLNPWITAGATIGTSVISRGDWSAGVFLGVHIRSFGGMR